MDTSKIRIGFGTIIGICSVLGAIGLAIGGAVADTNAAGLPPKWAALLAIVGVWVTQGGRYAQGFAQMLKSVQPIFDPNVEAPVAIPPVGFEPDANTIAALEAEPTHPGEDPGGAHEGEAPPPDANAPPEGTAP